MKREVLVSLTMIKQNIKMSSAAVVTSALKVKIIIKSNRR